MKKPHPSVPEERVDHVWRRIESTRSRRRGGTRSRTSRGAALIAAAAVALLVWHPWTEAQGDLSPLTLESGDLILIESVLVGPSRVGLSDGSLLALEEGAEVVPINNTGRVVEFVQRNGRVHYSVEGQGREWRIDAGGASVEIVGTEFVIDRSQGRLRVHVEEGVVLVRSEHVRDGVERLTAGESVEIETPSAQADSMQEETPASPNPVEALAPTDLSVGTVNSEHTASPETSTRVETSTLVDTMSTEDSRNAAELMNASDAARRQGRRADAERLLEEAIALGDGDSDLAALTLARSLEHTAPARAARLFERALELGLAEPLRRGAMRGYAETTEAAGGNATSAWRRFYDRYPDEPVQVLP